MYSCSSICYFVCRCYITLEYGTDIVEIFDVEPSLHQVTFNTSLQPGETYNVVLQPILMDGSHGPFVLLTDTLGNLAVMLFA